MRPKIVVTIASLLALAMMSAGGVAAWSSTGAVSKSDIAPLRQEIAGLQVALQDLRAENQELREQLVGQQRVVGVLMTRVEPDATLALTAAIAGFEDHDGMRNPHLTVREGDLVRLNLTNEENLEHDFIIDGVAHSSHLEKAGDSAMVVFVAPEPGEYTYYCSVPGHREAGMHGTLMVEEGVDMHAHSDAGPATMDSEGSHGSASH